MRRRILFYCCITALLISCKETNNDNIGSIKENYVSPIQSLLHKLNDSKDHEVLVVAHRADWRNAPENSLQAIQNCIDMGVDMVEIDVRETKDGYLVLMHDRTIDRTTNGSGFVKDWTLDSLKTLQLLDGLEVPTPHKIPTLREALTLTKDKILVNLDKSYAIFDKCFRIIQETGTQDQVIIKGAKNKSLVQDEFGEYLDKVLFMPIVRLHDLDANKIVNEYMEENPPVAIEFTVKYDTLSGIKKFEELREKGTSVWVNALWPQHNGGHDDEKAALNPSVYDWYIDNHINIIQTDRPELLLKYLRGKKLHK
ncbi:glycerophosphodiester phosphodiesterase family protein [Aestuariivivens sediminis]|uniref:glycerophosphodiester phosphodiesterase family protein n=1 Tax=Aestuariivivens sediminis TaxID=2913557 RepID=UPI001F57EDFB|nr:glycerophosphodiester phosphodiesterase family protein [Aestuariivivens sediminis]